MLTGLHNFFGLVVAALAGLAGLFMAAHAELENSYYFGLGLFVAAVIWGITIVRRALDKADADDKELKANVGWMRERLKK